MARRKLGHSASAAIEQHEELRTAIELLELGRFSPGHPGRYRPIADDLRHLDHFMLTADFPSYWAIQREIDDVYRTPEIWLRKAILNTAHVGTFSSDRAIAEYAREIWRVPLEVS